MDVTTFLLIDLAILLAYKQLTFHWYDRELQLALKASKENA